MITASVIKGLNSGIIIFILYFSGTGLLVKRNLRRSLIKLGFVLSILFYNAVQSTFNLLTFMEERENFDTFSYEIS